RQAARSRPCPRRQGQHSLAPPCALLTRRVCRDGRGHALLVGNLRQSAATRGPARRRAGPSAAHDALGAIQEHHASENRMGRTRILVVDDNADTRASLRQLLELLGYEVETARDGAAALKAHRERSAAVVITDIL